MAVGKKLLESVRRFDRLKLSKTISFENKCNQIYGMSNCDTTERRSYIECIQSYIHIQVEKFLINLHKKMVSTFYTIDMSTERQIRPFDLYIRKNQEKLLERITSDIINSAT